MKGRVLFWPKGRNDLLFSKSTKRCKLQYVVDRGARMYRKLQHFLNYEMRNSFLLLGLFSQRFSAKQFAIGKPSTFDRVEVDDFLVFFLI